MMKIASARRDDAHTGDQEEKNRCPSSATDAHPLDTEFCRGLLPRVSRTFALSIEALPDSLRAAVRSAYLLCRLVDSIEDDPRLEGAQRIQLFAIFERMLDDGMETIQKATMPTYVR